MFITTKVSWDIDGKIIEKEGYVYHGPVALCCGASSQQNQIEAAQQQYYNTLTQQAQQEFGLALGNYNALFKALSPILAAGVDQAGFSAAEMSDLNNQALTGSSQAYQSAAQVARERAAASGGSQYIPTGATLQTNAALAGSAAAQQSSELNQIDLTSREVGRQNFFQAENALTNAVNVFNPSTGAANAATNAGTAAANTANQIAQENNSWMQAVSGAIGGIGGAIATGGMSNLGKGVGFFGQNAPAPG